jgi:hypothetical protein
VAMTNLVDAADRAVAGSEELQRYVRGERVAATPPGTFAFVAVNLLMLMSWLGISITVGTHVSHAARPVVTLAMAVGMAPVLCLLPYRIVLGIASAHRTMFYLTTALVVGCTLVILELGVRLGLPHVEAFFWLCLGASIMAHRLVRSPGYALCAAFFRARRAYRLELKRRKQQVLGH